MQLEIQSYYSERCTRKVASIHHRDVCYVHGLLRCTFTHFVFKKIFEFNEIMLIKVPPRYHQPGDKILIIIMLQVTLS